MLQNIENYLESLTDLEFNGLMLILSIKVPIQDIIKCYFQLLQNNNLYRMRTMLYIKLSDPIRMKQFIKPIDFFESIIAVNGADIIDEADILQKIVKIIFFILRYFCISESVLQIIFIGTAIYQTILYIMGQINLFVVAQYLLFSLGAKGGLLAIY